MQVLEEYHMLLVKEAVLGNMSTWETIDDVQGQLRGALTEEE